MGASGLAADRDARLNPGRCGQTVVMDDEHEFTPPTVEQVTGPGSDRPEPDPDLPGIAPEPVSDDEAPEQGEPEEGPEPDDDPATAGSA